MLNSVFITKIYLNLSSYLKQSKHRKFKLVWVNFELEICNEDSILEKDKSTVNAYSKKNLADVCNILCEGFIK